ncbi:MAG: VOC family protein [Candidatus Acidiferrales bacterium]
MSQSEIKLGKIGVVMLGVSQLALSLAFYRDTLGMKLQNQFEGFAFLEAGGVTLVLSEPLARAIGAAPGSSEIVFSVDGVRESFDALKSRGVAFDIEPRVVSGPMWAANFRDPDGHRLSIFGPEHSAS